MQAWDCDTQVSSRLLRLAMVIFVVEHLQCKEHTVNGKVQRVSDCEQTSDYETTFGL